MFVRFMSDHPPSFKAGQCVEVPDRCGALYLGRACEVVSQAVVREYEATMAAADRAVARAVDKHFNETSRAAGKTAGRRELSEDQWRASLGVGQCGYQQARLAYIAGRINVSGRLPAEITVRS
jgi:hypothetical protein